MTSIAGYSAYGGNNKQPQLIDDSDNYRAQEKVKELLRYGYGGKPRNFDDLLQLMGKAQFQAETKVLLADFEQVVRKAAEETKGSLNNAGISAHDIKTVFRAHCVEPDTQGMA
jgi:hypothetical protein